MCRPKALDRVTIIVNKRDNEPLGTARGARKCIYIIYKPEPSSSLRPLMTPD